MSDKKDNRIAEAQAGDDGALASLLSEHYTYLYKYMLKVSMDPELAEDICQDTMVRCMEKIGSYNGSSSFSSWLVTIATRLYIDRMRRRGRERRYVQEQGLRSLRWRFESRNEAWSDVMEVLAGLPAERRIPLLLKHYYGYSYDEIGAMLQIPAGTAKSRVSYGLNQLRKELGRDETV